MNPAELPADTWGPMPLRWRHTRAGDLVLTGTGDAVTVWVLTLSDTFGRVTRTAAVSGRGRHAAEVDPDDRVTVLVPLAERESIRLLREQMGAAVAHRR